MPADQSQNVDFDEWIIEIGPYYVLNYKQEYII